MGLTSSGKSLKKNDERDSRNGSNRQEGVSPLLTVKMEGATWQGVVGGLDEP